MGRFSSLPRDSNKARAFAISLTLGRLILFFLIHNVPEHHFPELLAQLVLSGLVGLSLFGSGDQLSVRSTRGVMNIMNGHALQEEWILGIFNITKALWMPGQWPPCGWRAAFFRQTSTSGRQIFPALPHGGLPLAS